MNRAFSELEIKILISNLNLTGLLGYHNHILPGLDDGAKSMEMTLNMLREASKQGIATIVNTIHFQHPKMEGKNTDYQYVKDLRDKVLQEANNQNTKTTIYMFALNSSKCK